jgi:hypothetical protein
LGIDLLDFVRGVLPWGKFHRMVELLPEFGRYKLAVADDDDLAEQVVARRNGRPAPKAGGVSLQAWSPDREQTANLVDVLVSIRQQILAGQLKKGKKPPQVAPAPRPRTALQRAEQKRNRSHSAHLRSKLLPNGSAPQPDNHRGWNPPPDHPARVEGGAEGSGG